MKTNKLKYMACSGVLLLLTVFATVSCDDANDWGTDSSYNRLFSVPKMSVSANATDAELTWTTTPGTEYYLIEVSLDSLYDDIAMGSSKGAIIYGEDKSITKSPYTLEGLYSDSKYFIRMKALSASTPESKWGYMSDFSFKPRTEQIFEKWIISHDKITLYWPVNSVADRIEITDVNGTIVKNVTLTSTNLEDGNIVIDGLTPLTSYTATLYNKESKRGVVDFTTTAKVPDADYTAFLQPGDSLNNDLFTTMAEAGYQTVNVALPAGSTYYNENNLNIPDGMSVTFFGLSGEKQAVIGVKGIDIAGSHSFIKFENVEIAGKAKKADGNSTTNDYLFNQSKASTVGTIEFSNSFISGFKNTPVRLQGSDSKIIDLVKFENCTVYGADSRTYSLIHIDAGSGKGKIDNIEFSKTTVVYSGKCLVYSRNTDFTSLKLSDCTFSKLLGSGDYILDCDKNGNGPSQGVTITNCIFGSTLAEGKGIRANDKPVEVTNSYITNDMKITGNKINDLIPYDGGESDLFKDPAQYDFTIIDSGFTGKTNCGDPKWYMK